MEMVESRKTVTNSTALVIAKQALIADVMKDIKLAEPDNRGRKTIMYRDALEAGRNVGDKASFGRPVEDKQGMLRIGK